MRKLFPILMCILLCVGSVVGFGEEYDIHISYAPLADIESEDDYEEFIRNNSLPEYFIPYENLDFIGLFRSFLITDYAGDNTIPETDNFSYTFSVPRLFDGYLSLRFTHMDSDSFNANLSYLLKQQEFVPVEDLSTSPISEGRSYCKVGSLYYDYWDGKLEDILLYDKSTSLQCRVSLLFVAFDELSQHVGEKEDFILQLLSPDCAESAGERLLYAMRGEKKCNPLWIALPVGVAVIGGGVAVILLRRKRKKAVTAATE